MASESLKSDPLRPPPPAPSMNHNTRALNSGGYMVLKGMRSKYGAKRTVVDGIPFHSKKEAKRYEELRLLEKAGEIHHLELQPKYPLIVTCPHCDRPCVMVGTYIADFRYRLGPRGLLVVEDVKSKATRTALFRLKKRMVEAQYSITITEV